MYQLNLIRSQRGKAALIVTILVCIAILVLIVGAYIASFYTTLIA